MADTNKGHFRKIKPTRFSRLGEDPPKEKKIYPKFRIDLKHLPEARKRKIGDKYYVGLELEQRGLTDTDYDKSVEFDIIGIKVGDKSKKKD